MKWSEVEEGKRYYENLRPEDRQPVWREIIAVLTLMLYCGWMNIFLTLCIASLFSPLCFYIVILLLSTLLIPAQPVLWPSFNKLFIFKTWREYFRFSYMFEEKLDANKKYIMVEFPHGSFPIAQVTAGTMLQSLFPDEPIYSVAASSVFYIPLWRHIIGWVGAMPATRENFKLQLTKRGTTAVVVGGIAEMFMLDEFKERVKLLGRKGWARIALEEDVDGIVPCYYFGQSRLLAFGPSWLAGISRRIRVSLAFYLVGRWGLPLPKALSLFLVHGHVIKVPKGIRRGDLGFEEAVDQLVGAAAKELQDLYDRHKEEYGWKERPLSIE